MGRDLAAISSSRRHSGSGHHGALELPPYDPSLDAVGANVCNICRRRFENAQGVADHKRDRHPCCPACHQTFEATTALQGHQRAMGHCYCDEHQMAFTNQRAFRDHERREPHTTGFECLDCGRPYSCGRALDHHVAECPAADPDRIADQGRSAEAAAARLAELEEINLRCESCNRTFPDLHAQRQHKRSLKHNPLSEIRCFLSPRCTQVFKSPSAFIFHLESSGCKSGMDRRKLNSLVHAADTDNRITSPENTGRLASSVDGAHAASLLSALGTLSVSSSNGGIILDPSQSAASASARSTSRPCALRARSTTSETTTTTIRGGRILTPDESDAAASASDNTTIPLGTPTESVSSSARRSVNAAIHEGNVRRAHVDTDAATVTSDSDGGAALTPLASIASTSVGTARVATPASTNAGGEWSFIPGYPGEADDIHYDTDRQVWTCDICDAAFRERKGLEQHLNSPVHETNLYSCSGVGEVAGTSGTRRGHAKMFKTLSGMAQHMEAGSCQGGQNALGSIAALFARKIRDATGQEVALVQRRG